MHIVRPVFLKAAGVVVFFSWLHPQEQFSMSRFAKGSCPYRARIEGMLERRSLFLFFFSSGTLVAQWWRQNPPKKRPSHNAANLKAGTPDHTF